MRILLVRDVIAAEQVIVLGSSDGSVGITTGGSSRSCLLLLFGRSSTLGLLAGAANSTRLLRLLSAALFRASCRRLAEPMDGKA